MNAAFTCSNGIVCIPRFVNGCLMKFGQDPAGCMENHKPKLNQPENKFFPNLNCLRNKFELSYGGKHFYLAVDEALVNWSAQTKFLPISVYYNDYLIRDKDQKIVDYKEQISMTVFYSASFDIFEALIRRGLMNNEVEITSHQLNRICNPVLEDQNQNLLF